MKKQNKLRQTKYRSTVSQDASRYLLESYSAVIRLSLLFFFSFATLFPIVLTYRKMLTELSLEKTNTNKK